jgi:Flp pilus assembly protein TadG
MTLEFAIMAPILVMFLTLLAYAGRVVDLKGQLDGVARDAARAASTGRDTAEATQLANDAVNADLNGQQWCNGAVSVIPDFGDFRAGGFVRVTVSCDLAVADLSMLPLPAVPSSGTGVAPIDTYTRREAPK